MAKTRRSTSTTRTPRKPAARPLTPALALETLRAGAAKALRVSTRTLVERAQGAREAVATRVDAARSRTGKAMNRLERVFEQRVSQAVSKLGVPSARDVRALSRQVAELQATVVRLRRSRARA